MQLNTGSTTGEKKHFTEYRSDEYSTMLPMWQTAWVHYEANFTTLRTSKYLIQRTQGESATQFNERLKTADYLPLFGTTVDSLVGRLMAIEPIPRRWQLEGTARGLGQPKDADSVAGSIWRNIDGTGTNYLTMVEDMSIRLCVLNSMWVYVRGVEKDEETGEIISDASVTLIEPAAVVNVFRDAQKNPIDVLVQGGEDSRESIEDAHKSRTVYTRFKTDGTIKYTVVESKTGAKSVEEGPLVPYGDNGFAFYTTKDRTRKMVPIFEIKLPLRRFVGNILAEKNGVIFNQESERDNILRIACTPAFVFVGNDTQFKNTQEARISGDNAMQLAPDAQNVHYYTSPPTEPADLRTKVLRDKIADFFVSAFRFYEDSIRGKQKTATEIGQDAASGEGSFLNTLSTAVDEAENRIGWLIEQVTFPTEPTKWGQFYVERPREFTPIDAIDEADKLATLFFGKFPVPVGPTGKVSASKKIATAHKLEFVDEEVELEIRQLGQSQVQESQSQAENEIPEEEEDEKGEAGKSDDDNDG